MKNYRMKTKALVFKVVTHLEIHTGSSFILVERAEHSVRTPMRERKFS